MKSRFHVATPYSVLPNQSMSFYSFLGEGMLSTGEAKKRYFLESSDLAMLAPAAVGGFGFGRLQVGELEALVAAMTAAVFSSGEHPSGQHDLPLHIHCWPL